MINYVVTTVCSIVWINISHTQQNNETVEYLYFNNLNKADMRFEVGTTL